MTSKPATPAKLGFPPGPVTILDGPVSNGLAHLQPVLLLLIHNLLFSALVASPVSTLLQSLVPVTFLQLSYAVVCLPAAGTTVAPPSKKGRRVVKRTSSLGGNISAALLSACFALICGPPVLTTIMIIFGAPFTTHFFHTFLAAAHLSVLTLLPLVYVHGLEAGRWRVILTALLPLDEVYGASVGCLVGAWLGAVPIPLDWDREWQAWPVTIVTGAYMGYGVGAYAGRYLLKGKTMEFDSASKSS